MNFRLKALRVIEIINLFYFDRKIKLDKNKFVNTQTL